MRIKKILRTTKRSLTSPKRVFTIFGDVGPSCSSDYKLRIFILNNKFYKHSGADGIQLVSSQAPIGIGIFSDPVISTSSCSLWRLSGFGTWVHRESRNPRCIGSRIRIENAHACTFPFFFAHSAVFDTGRSQNDYNNYFIRRGSGPLCLPILKVITRCLHCPSGTALRVPSCLSHDTLCITHCTMNLHFMYTRLRVPCASLLFRVTLPSRTMHFRECTRVLRLFVRMPI